MVPAADQFLQTHLFGDIFARDNLDLHSREIATVAALATLDGLEGQLKSHVGIALNGTGPQLRDLATVLGDRVGGVPAERAISVLDEVPAAGRA